MDEDKRHLLQEPGRELVGFVARRFDPDPEAGDKCQRYTKARSGTVHGFECTCILRGSFSQSFGHQVSSCTRSPGFWQLNAGQPPTFVPSVAEPWHLSEMIRDIFRLAVCGSRDNRLVNDVMLCSAEVACGKIRS